MQAVPGRQLATHGCLIRAVARIPVPMMMVYQVLDCTYQKFCRTATTKWPTFGMPCAAFALHGMCTYTTANNLPLCERMRCPICHGCAELPLTALLTSSTFNMHGTEMTLPRCGVCTRCHAGSTGYAAGHTRLPHKCSCPSPRPDDDGISGT
jgi:hypothetical protein